MPDRKLANQVVKAVPLAMRFIRREVKRTPGRMISFSHYQLLARMERAIATNSELAHLQGVSVAAMTRAVDTLCRRGLIHRARRPDDRRRVQVELTKKGKDAVARVREAIESRVASRLDRLAIAERKALGVGLKVLEVIFS